MASPLRFQHFEVLTRADGSPHLLGKGAMGLTYKAFDRSLLSFAVVKVMTPEQAARPEARQRFEQEAQSMARIKHPNVADVFFLGESAQGFFYAMEFCDGPSPQEYVEEHGPMNPADVFMLGRQAAEALRAVQRNNLIHRDVKPSNIILVNDVRGMPQLKLIDFGLARDVVSNPDLSQGGFVGTPTFASPEQLLELGGLDIRSDIYSLGITLWFMLCGRAPFGGSQFEVMFHHVNTPPPWDRLPPLPAGAVEVIRRMIEKSPEARYQTPDALSEAFRVVLEEGGFEAPASGLLSFRPRELTGSVLGMSSFEILSESPDSDLTGKIFKARDAHDGRIISLKYLHPAMVEKGDVLGRIQRHVLSLRSLRHPNLIGIIDFEKSDAGAQIISEWVHGPSVLALLKARNHLTLAEAAPLLAQLASAFDFAASRGLGTLETDLHQIFLTSPAFGEDPAAWPGPLRRPVSSWPELTVKVNPLRLSPAAQDYPTINPTLTSSALAGGPKPLLGAFLHLAYRMLGGVGGSQSGSSSGFVSIPGLGAEANDLIESFGLPPFTPEKRGATAASVLTGLCQAESVPVPEIHQVPPEPEENLDLTRIAGQTDQPTRQGSTFAPPRGDTAAQSPRFARNPASGQSSPSTPGPQFARPASRTGGPGSSQTRPGTRQGSVSGSSAGRISADYDLKRKELELQRQRLESEAERLKQAELLDATRAMLDEERAALAEARDEFARQERDRAQRAEQERRKLEEERARLEARTTEVESKRREQERLEQEIKLRAQLEFQKFEEERRQREADWARQREDTERALQEREEQSLLREQESFRRLRQERERLLALQQGLEEGKVKSQQEAEEALRRQVTALEAERRALADQQAELDRRLLTQNQELAGRRAEFEAAERGIEERHARLAAEEAAAVLRRQEAMDAERRRLDAERAQLERHRAELAAEREAGSVETQAALEQRQANEAAMARLAEAETRFAEERAAMERQRQEREAALAEELARARRELEEERAAMARESARIRESGLAELEAAGREMEARHARLAAEEAASALRRQEALDAERLRLDGERAQLERHRAELAAEREAGSEGTRAGLEQRQANEAAMARLAEAEARFAEEREAVERRRQEREAELAAELARARQELESDRAAMMDQQAELERRRLAQAQEQADLRMKFETAAREMEERHARRAAEETAAALRRQEAMDAERLRLDGERAQLERHRAELAAEREAGSAGTQAALEERQANEAAMARLAEAEARFAEERGAMERQRQEREAALAAELARARQELEGERAAMVLESARARETALAELQAERDAMAAARARLAAEEAGLAARLELKTRDLEEQLARQKGEIDTERAALAARRDALETEHERLTQFFSAEKAAQNADFESRRQREEDEHLRRMQERAAEIGRLESDENARLAALRMEIAAEEERLRNQKQEVFSQERLINRMDQEASYQDDEAREKLEAEQRRLEGQREEVERKILELRQAQKKRLITLVAGTLIGTAAAAAAGFFIKGQLIDPGKLKGQEAWVQYEKERQSRLTTRDWPALLHWCVETDERFRKQEKDEVVRTFYQTRRGAVLEDARQAIDGILAGLEKGEAPPPPEEDTGKKLRQDLTLLADWDGLPPERFLLQAKLELPHLTARKNPGRALALYTDTVGKNAGFVKNLRKELEVTVQGLLKDFLEDHALDDRDGIQVKLSGLSEQAKDSVPRTRLLLNLLEAERKRATVPPEAEAYGEALTLLNGTATEKATRDFYNADPEWRKILAAEIPRVLDTIKLHPEMILSLESVLRPTAEFWKMDTPYMMLVDSAATLQQKVDFSKAAIRLTGNLKAKAFAGGHYWKLAGALRNAAGSGDMSSKEQRDAVSGLLRQVSPLVSGTPAAAEPEGMLQAAEKATSQLLSQASALIREASAGGEPEGVFLHAVELRSGLGEEKNLEAAIGKALQLKELKHPEADYMLGLCYLEQAEESSPPSLPLARKARKALEAATESPGSINTAAAWYNLAKIYNMEKDTPRMITALEAGAKGGDASALAKLGSLQLSAMFGQGNVTLGRDNLTKAARMGNREALSGLRKNKAVWEASKIPADRRWLEQNADLLK